RGWTVIPVYETELGRHKGPQIYTPEYSFIAPDLMAFKDARFRFIEAKNKSVFTWHRKTETWQTGIDLHHYRQYLAVAEHFNLDVWLMFLHESAIPSAIDLKHSGCPSQCPIGLFANTLRRLSQDGCGRTDTRWSKSGMV